MRPLPRSRLRDDIVRELASLIASGELGEAERLKEAELAAGLGVSRTPLREALLVLEREGLVESEVNKGFRVTALSEGRVRELYPILGALEALAVREGGARLTARAGELCEANARLAASRGRARRHELDRRFHELLWEGSTNATLVSMLRNLWLHAQRFDGAAERGMANFEGSVREHAAIAEALGRGDVECAATRLEAHWRDGIEVVVGWLRRRAARLAPLAVLALVCGCVATPPPAAARPEAHATTPANVPGTTTPAPRGGAAPGPLVPAPGDGAAKAPTLTPAPCPVPVAEGEAIDCFTLVVPESRGREDSKTIALPVVRFRSRAARPAEPLVFVGGGPGSSAIGRRLSGATNPVLDERDYVLFAQRGTRFATPELACPDYDEANGVVIRRDLAPGAATALRRAMAADCARELRKRGVDLDAYDTAAIVADLLDLRRALGVPAVSLYSISYGTRVALEAMRREPSAIRSAVLDSVLPPDVRYDEMATDNTLRSLDRVLDQCAVDPACAKAYPDLRSRFRKALERATKAPVALSIEPALGGAKVALRLTGRHLVEAVYSRLNSAEAIPTLPALLDAVARGDFGRAAATYLEGAGPSGFSYGQRLSVWCRDEAPVTDARAVAAQSSQHPEFDGWGTAAFDPLVCRAWPVTPSRADRSAVISDVPTLIFAGEYDPTTPPEWGRRTLAGLKNGYFVELPGMSHVAGFGACGRSITLAFLRDPSRMPDTSCAARSAAPAFVR